MSFFDDPTATPFNQTPEPEPEKKAGAAQVIAGLLIISLWLVVTPALIHCFWLIIKASWNLVG